MDKWADYCIFKVHYNDEHTHIVNVKLYEDNGEKLVNEQEFARTKVVSSIKGNKTFVTITKNKQGNWDRGEDVRIVTINGKEYIRTDKNNMEKDNLGNLPEY